MTLKLASKEEILQAIEDDNFAYFEDGEYITGEAVSQSYKTDEEYDAFWNRRDTKTLTPEEQADEEIIDSVQTVERHNDGDGRTMYLTLHFKPYDLFVSLNGTYSSHGSSSWQEVFVSEQVQQTIYVYNRVSNDEQGQ